MIKELEPKLEPKLESALKPELKPKLKPKLKPELEHKPTSGLSFRAPIKPYLWMAALNIFVYDSR